MYLNPQYIIIFPEQISTGMWGQQGKKPISDRAKIVSPYIELLFKYWNKQEQFCQQINIYQKC